MVDERDDAAEAAQAHEEVEDDAAAVVGLLRT